MSRASFGGEYEPLIQLSGESCRLRPGLHSRLRWSNNLPTSIGSFADCEPMRLALFVRKQSIRKIL
jgi:hypothetical protein